MDHGKRRSSRPDGWRGIAAVGPAHGSQRNSARFRPRPASAFGGSSVQPLHRLCGGHRVDSPLTKQHRNRPDHEFLHRRGPGQPGPGAGDHARRQCRNHADRSNPVVQHRRRRSRSVHHRAGRLPQRRPFADQGRRPRRDRSRPDAAGAAYSARHAGAGGECARHAGLHERHHRRSRALHYHRRCRYLGGAFKRGQRSAGHVAGLRAVHIAFNVATAIIFIGLLDGMARLLKKLLPNRVQETDPSRPRYLDQSALETPSLALADAARETLHMGDHVEIMLRKVMAAMMTNDRALVDQVSQMDNSVDSLDEAIKLYVTKLTRGSLDEREGQRAMEIVSFAINLEHMGDIIDKNLSELATKKIKRRFQFSPEGADELSAFHKRTMDSLRIAFGVFMSGDVNEARKLLAEKAALRNAELAATERHLDRLREGRPETIETTSLHLDVLRDLRRIHSHICSVAYPVLDAAGELPARQVAENDLATLPK